MNHEDFAVAVVIQTAGYETAEFAEASWARILSILRQFFENFSEVQRLTKIYD